MENGWSSQRVFKNTSNLAKKHSIITHKNLEKKQGEGISRLQEDGGGGGGRGGVWHREKKGKKQEWDGGLEWVQH